jgi:cytoskeleton protein RodZ
MTGLAGPAGPRLKAERERRGLSAQKAADELHLDGWVVDALEAEDYERIGPSVYAKGHLKRYAALLGLPPTEIIAGYESRVQSPKAPPAQPANVRLRTDTPAVSGLPWPGIAGSVAAVLLVVGLFWWKPWQHHEAPPVGETVAANPTAASPDNADGSSAAAVSGAPSSPPVPTAGSSSLAAAPTAASVTAAGPVSQTTASPEPDTTAGMGRARMRLSFSADSWVDVHDAAGRRVFAGNGRANSVKTIAGIAPMRVYLGFASGVQLEINDRAVAIGPQFLAGDVARFEAGADGVLRRDSHTAAAPGAATPALTTPSAQARNARPTG